MPRKLIKFFSLLLSLLLIFEQSGLAQVAGQIDVSGYFTQLHQSLIQDKFRPLHLRYLSYDNQANSFKLLLDKGDTKFESLGNGRDRSLQLNNAVEELLKYFFIGLTLPNEKFWVNLRPDSPDNVIDEDLAKTDVGKILLEADLQLKKDTARFTSPAEPEGREYWDKLYKKAEELFANVGNGRDRSLQIPTLTRPWIVPNEIIVRESRDNGSTSFDYAQDKSLTTSAYIYKATLKVMLEEDYIKSQVTSHKSPFGFAQGRQVTSHRSQVNLQEYSFKDPRLKQLNEYSTQLIRETIIPKLTYEVNTSKRYAPLRQVYYSLILAQWFKSRFYGRGGLYSWLIDQKNLAGLTSKDPWSKNVYFKQYEKSFQDGEYNLKEPVYTPFGQSIRSYMSGGINLGPGILKAVNRELVSSSLEARLPSSKNITDLIEIIGGSVSTPFGIKINGDTIKQKASSALEKKQKDLGFCLTPDSLITLANSSQKPLIELKPHYADRSQVTSHRSQVTGYKSVEEGGAGKGKVKADGDGDWVLSLNEQTGRLEPHRVLALLDMGVKPVYRITTASGKSLKTTLTHPYLTRQGWRKLSEIKVGEEVAVVSEGFANTAGANERDFIPSNNYQRIFEKVKDVFFYKWRQDLKKSNRHKGIDSKEDYSFVSSQRESIVTTEVSIQRKYNPIFFCAERDNLFITCPFQPYIFGFNDIVAGFLQELNCAAEKAMVSKQPHSTYLVDNNLFVFEDSCGIVKAGLNVFNSDIRIALLDNLFGSKSLLNKFQDHMQRDSSSFDTGLAKADFGVNRDSFCQSIVSHYFHLLIILYHKIKEASSCILRPNAYAQLVSESDVLWDKIVSIESLGELPVYDIEVEATHNFIAQGIVAHNTYSNKKDPDKIETKDAQTLSREIQKAVGELRQTIQSGKDEQPFRDRLDKLIGLANKTTQTTYNKLANKYAELRGQSPVGKDLEFLQQFLMRVRENSLDRIGAQQQVGVLDVGTGVRDLRWLLEQEGVEAIGIDFSEGVVKSIQERLNQFKVIQQTVRQMDMLDLKFPDESFDGIRFSASLHHLPLIDAKQGADGAVREAYRVLKPGGVCFISVKVETLERSGFMPLDTAEGLGARFYQFYSPEMLNNLLIRQGFEAVEITAWADVRGEQQIAAFARKSSFSPNVPTLCLTPDSLITLADGSQKPLIEIKPHYADRSQVTSHRSQVTGYKSVEEGGAGKGKVKADGDGDWVLSLNEQTQKLEPHRVLALLDMGVKPVYRITTQGGKQLKTTLTHPYLTKDGWKKLQDIKVGDEITVMQRQVVVEAVIKEELFLKESEKDSTQYADYRGKLTNPENKHPLNYIGSQPADFFGKPSFKSFFCQRDNVFFGSFFSFVDNFNQGISAFISKFLPQYSRYGNYCHFLSFSSKPPKAYHSFKSLSSLFTSFSSLVSMPFSRRECEAAEIAASPCPDWTSWEKIISIEPLGQMPVYDIEVEATHNFIAQGIVAHNTYTPQINLPVTAKDALDEVGQRDGGTDGITIDFQGDLPGDEAGFYEPAYAVSTEAYDETADKLRELIEKQNIERGGVYVGVSFEQNLSFIAVLNPELAIILDSNRYVTEILFPMIVTLIKQSGDLEDMKKRLSGLTDREKVDRLIVAALPSQLHQMARAVWMEKGSIWVEQWSTYWQKEGAWLSSKEGFDTVKRLAQDSKIKMVSGDWYKKAPQYLARYLRDINKKVSGLYLSNAVPADMSQNFLENIENLPKSAKCVVIHGLGSYVNPVIQPYNASILKIAHDLREEKKFPIIYLADGLYWLGLEANGRLFSDKMIKKAVEPIKYIFMTYKDAYPHWLNLIKNILKVQIDTVNDSKAQRIYQEALNKLNEEAGGQELSVSSALGNDMGGIDLKALPIVRESMPRFSSSVSRILRPASQINLDEEWAQIQKMLNAEIMPSSERLREYALASSSLSPEDYGREIDRLLGCIADILRLEEGRVLPTESALREMLILLESDKPASELQLALSKITVLPKVPQRN